MANQKKLLLFHTVNSFSVFEHRFLLFHTVKRFTVFEPYFLLYHTVNRFSCFAPRFLPLSRMSRSSTETCLALSSARGSCREIRQSFLAAHAVDWLLERSLFHQLLNEFVEIPVSRRKGITKLFGIRVSGIRLCLQEQGAGARGGGV